MKCIKKRARTRLFPRTCKGERGRWQGEGNGAHRVMGGVVGGRACLEQSSWRQRKSHGALGKASRNSLVKRKSHGFLDNESRKRPGSRQCVFRGALFGARAVGARPRFEPGDGSNRETADNGAGIVWQRGRLRLDSLRETNPPICAPPRALCRPALSLPETDWGCTMQ